jgi:hypothetical protein
MGLYDQLQASIEEVIETYKGQTADGKLSFSDALTLTYNATATFVRLVEGLGYGGHDKKDTVLLAIAKFYDIVIRPLPLTGLPGPLESLVDTALKSLILTLVSAWIDALVNIFSKLGWATKVEAEGPENLKHFLIF